MRSSVVPTLARWLSPLVALSVLGCPKQELAPLGPCTVSAVSERVDQSGVADVDLLFVIDNSGSMASEQLKLAAQLPKLVTVLTTGDRYPGVPDNMLPAGVTAETRKFTPVKTMHLGVVSTNAGGIDDFPSASGEAVLSCAAEGDDGRLQNSTTIAVDGVKAKFTGEFQGYANMETVLPPRDPECRLSNVPKYQDFEAGSGDTPAEIAANFSCVSALGVRGCPFEQQLESMWKALAPAEGIGDPGLFTFINGTRGQGDGYNAGFLRPNAILAVLIVSDEEDCSITDAGKSLFDLTGDTSDINVRCGFAADNTELVQATQRYVSGLKSLKPANPDRIIFGVIAGFPQDAIRSNQSYDEILRRADMQFQRRIDAGGQQFPIPSCTTTTNGKTDEAYPPRRMLEVAKGFPDQSVIYSICEDDYGPALDTLIQKIASKLSGNCLPRVLNPGDDGLVNCEVFELLPEDDQDDCPAEYGLTGSPINRNLLENGKIVPRKACKMDQLAVTGNNEIATGNGWYYDDFSTDLASDCTAGERQRISFSFGNGTTTTLPNGAGATFECFQPVARIDNDAKGFDAVNTRCAAQGLPSDAICEGKSNDDYELFCQPDSVSCQISCANNPDCPPGWVCEPPLGTDGGSARKYCQLPTCPQDSSGT